MSQSDNGGFKSAMWKMVDAEDREMMKSAVEGMKRPDQQEPGKANDRLLYYCSCIEQCRPGMQSLGMLPRPGISPANDHEGM